jgi:hypothetical protein
MSFHSLDAMMAHYSAQRVQQAARNTTAWARAEQCRKQGVVRRAAAQEHEWREEPSCQVAATAASA